MLRECWRVSPALCNVFLRKLHVQDLLWKGTFETPTNFGKCQAGNLKVLGVSAYGECLLPGWPEKDSAHPGQTLTAETSDMGQINHNFEVWVSLQWLRKEDICLKCPLSCTVPSVISLQPCTLHLNLCTETQHCYKFSLKLL